MLTEIDPGMAFLVAGFLALVALGLWWRARRFVARLVHASGRITHFISRESKQWKGEGQGSETVVDYLPHVEFQLPTGERVTFQSRSSRSHQASQGATVSVLYDPGAPASSAEIEGRPAWFKAWTPVIVAIVLSLVAVLLGLLPRLL
jgi:hypothetical protein